MSELLAEAGDYGEIATPPFAAVTFIERWLACGTGDDGFMAGEHLSRGNVIAAPSLAELRRVSAAKRSTTNTSLHRQRAGL